jgi:multimeric flavodoxin WrbA
MASQILAELETHGVVGHAVRVVDFDIRPGVKADMGDGDDWPQIRSQILAADILVVVTPTWMGQLTSVGQRVLERLDAELSATQEDGRLSLFDKVAVAGIVGNEDGAHHISSQLFQALNDVGFTIAAQGATYWNGEAMHSLDYIDLKEVPDEVASATSTAAANAAHLAQVLKDASYPPSGM